MKKLLLVLTVAAFVACNDAGTKTEEGTTPDTPATEQAPTQPDTAQQAAPDTAHVDSASLKK